MVVAVDLPSGIDADTGEVHGTAIQCRRDGHVRDHQARPARSTRAPRYAGTAELIDIGLLPYLPEPAVTSLQAADVAAMLPRPSAESDKYRRGVLGAGRRQRPVHGRCRAVGGRRDPRRRRHGPAGLGRDRDRGRPAALARGGARRPTIRAIPAQAIEAAGRVQAWAAGPGIGTGPEAYALLTAVLATDLPVLRRRGRPDGPGRASRPAGTARAPTLITPHAGELARLLRADRADIEARRLHYARRPRRRARASRCCSKAPRPSSRLRTQPAPVRVNSTGSSWLATAGSGDVLSGLAGRCWPRALPPADAAAAAAYLHGMAGRLAARDAPIGASDLIGAIPAAIRAVHRQLRRVGLAGHSSASRQPRP